MVSCTIALGVAAACVLALVSVAAASAQTDTATTAATASSTTAAATAVGAEGAPAVRVAVDDDGPDRLVLIALIGMAVILALVVLWNASDHVRRLRREGVPRPNPPPAGRPR